MLNTLLLEVFSFQIVGYCLFVTCSWEVANCLFCLFFFQAEDGIRDLVRSRGLGDVYKRQVLDAREKSPINRDGFSVGAPAHTPSVQIETVRSLSLIHI